MQASHDVIKTLEDLINSGKGETGRLHYILHTLIKGKKLYSSDQKYVENLLSKSVDKQTLPILDEEYLTCQIIEYDKNYCGNNITKPLEIELSEIRENLEHITERIERLQIRIEKSLEQLSNLQHCDDIIYQDKEPYGLAVATGTKNKTLDEFSDIKKKPIFANKFHTAHRLLAKTTIIIIVTTLATFAAVGVFEDKVRWQDYGITYEQAVYMLFLLIILSTFQIVAWLVYIVASFLENRKRKISLARFGPYENS